MDYQVKHMGKHRNNARLWFETVALESVGLTKGTRYRAHWSKDHNGFVIMADPQGERVVSGKEKGGRTIPIIDINSSEVLGKLADEPAVKVRFVTDGASPKHIIITKLSSAEMQHARENRLAKGLASMVLTMAAICFGGGVMDHAAAQGLQAEGFKTQLQAVVEIDGDLVEHARQHNPVITSDTRIYNTPMQELVQDHGAMSELPAVDVLVTGIPCSGASISGKSKLGLDFAEMHPEVGHLVVPYLMLVNRFQPAVAVVECVVPYSKTVSAQLMRQMFRDMGYTTKEVTLNSWDFGSLEERKRWFLVATTKGLSVDLEGRLTPIIQRRPQLRDVLEQVPSEAWRQMPGLVAKEIRDTEAGKGFKMQLVDGGTEKIGTIGKDYNKNRSTEPKVVHPAGGGLLRLLTPTEHARIKDFPAACIEGLSTTAAHQLLGQSVDCRPVRALFQRIGSALKEWKRDHPVVATMPYSLGRATG
jgi:DNA (cytosine-5)-methyltransferase 1